MVNEPITRVMPQSPVVQTLESAIYRINHYLDCLQSAIFLKIRVVLISASTIANHDIMLQ